MNNINEMKNFTKQIEVLKIIKIYKTNRIL